MREFAMASKALSWLHERSSDRPPVFLETEIPDSVQRELKRADLWIQVPGGVVVVRSPGDEPDDVLRSLLWPVVQRLTAAYSPAVVERDSAVRLYLGRTDPGPEIRLRQTGGTRWREEVAPGIVLRVERGPVDTFVEIEAGEAKIPVDPPERVLLSLSLGFLREGGLEDVTIWLKSLTLPRADLLAAYRDNPRPVVLKRMEHIARDVGNERLADLLGDIVSMEQRVRIGRDRTGVGRSLVVSPLVTKLRTTRQPWLDRLRVRVRDSRDRIAAVLNGFDPSRITDHTDLLARARSARAYDAYHSSSIEGYRLSMDEVGALLGTTPGEATDVVDLRSRMAIMGYGIAFDRLLDRLEDVPRLGLDGELALDLYSDLFTPSVEAGVVDAGELRGWRGSPVYIRDTLFVPPGPEKVPGMVELLFRELAEIPFEGNGLLRAMLAHMWFVWIHPFPDGNGRVARFLMNAALLSDDLPWLTIRVEDRDAYFETLRRAQFEDAYEPFARFVAERVG